MIIWLSEEEFSFKVDLDHLLDSILCISGKITTLDKLFFNYPYEELNEPQFLGKAWRWHGTINCIPFYLDIAVHPVSESNPFIFYLYALSKNNTDWNILKPCSEILHMMGKPRIDKINTQAEVHEYMLLRTISESNLKDMAKIIYSSLNESVCIGLYKYLEDNFSDSGLYLAKKVC